MDLNRRTIKFCKCANGLPRTALSVDIILLMCLFESHFICCPGILGYKQNCTMLHLFDDL